MEFKIKKCIYRHFKGNKYRVLGIAKHSETLEDTVVYKSLENGEMWVRPAKMWNDEVSADGKKVKRFTYLCGGENPVIRKATKDDIKQIAEIYDRILTEEENGNATTGWIRGIYPTEATALQALENDDLFVLEDEGRVVAAARINQIQVPEYANADWQHKNVPDNQIMVLHTLVVDTQCAGKGYGTYFVAFYEDYAKQNGCDYLRMDTNKRNTAARSLYKKLGYSEADIVPCDFNGIDGIELVCLEKYLG